MPWDPVTTLRRALWIGGGQWAGKSTVAGILTERHNLTHYHYDYHDARGHHDRHLAARARRGEPLVDPGPAWATATPHQLAEEARQIFAERFEAVRDDLRGLSSPHPILAEGWGLRPELVVPLSSPTRMVVLVATEEFRRVQAARLARAAALTGDAQRNRLARDRLLAEDAVRQAGLLLPAARAVTPPPAG